MLLNELLNSQVSSWFCRTNAPLTCRYLVLNVVVPEKCFKGLPLKFYFRPFGGIRSNRKWNLKSAVNRKRQPEMVFTVGIEGFKAWGMTWASQIGLIMCYFLTIYTLGCREPAWNLGGQLFWNLTVKVMKTEIRNSKLLRKENNAIIESCYVSAKESHDKGNIRTWINAYFHWCNRGQLKNPDISGALYKFRIQY